MRKSIQTKTKIICTIGPATNTLEQLVELIKAGTDVVRLNFSHGSYDDHVRALQNVREASRQTGEAITVLQDLQGPKIRIGELAAPLLLKQGDPLTITTEPVVGDARKISTTYTHLTSDVRAGDTILLDDGKIRLSVVEVDETDVKCEVVVGGRLTSNKGINLPGVTVSAPSLTKKDLRDLEFGVSQDVDYIALSFVRTADDIRQLRKAIVERIERGRFLPVIAKIEKPQAVANIDSIIDESDGIMVARGDLGDDLPPEDVPILQKMIIRKCNLAGKPVIIATQMLESMISNPTPTRAEASDVANAVVDGADCVMLSGETSIGTYPVEAVRIMERIIRKVEAEHLTVGRVMQDGHGVVENRHDALARAACVLAEQMNAAAIVTVTHSGQTARVIARYRPGPRLLAITDRAKILRRLNLIWGVFGMVIEDLDEDSDKALQKIQERLVEDGIVMRGDYVVMLAGQPFFARGSTNFIKVEKIQ